MEPGDSTRTKKMKTNEGGGRDRISNLPETVLYHILSFLDMKHVVQTSVLSKKWRYIWTSLPFLNFNCNLFCSKRNGECFKHFVDEVFLLRGISTIQSFRLSSDHSDDYCDIKNRLNSWILAALRRNVQEFYLDVLVEEDFRWPTCLFTSRSLTTLELHRIIKLSLPDSMSLPNLKTLVLHGVEGDDDIPNKIFSGCPVLESLVLRWCEFDQTNLDFHAVKLKHLVIENWTSIQKLLMGNTINFYAPNLISFRCKGYLSKGYFIENLSALVKADIDMGVVCDELESLGDETAEVNAQLIMKFLRALHNVKDLTLSARFFKFVSGALALLESTPIQFCNLKCLKLETRLSRDCINAITYLLKISLNIESLFLELKGSESEIPYFDEVRANSANVEIYREVRVPLQCMLYHLKFVQIRGVQGRLNELMFLEILLKNAVVLDKVVVHTSKEQSPGTKSRLIKFTEKLLTLPRASSSIAILLL